MTALFLLGVVHGVVISLMVYSIVRDCHMIKETRSKINLLKREFDFPKTRNSAVIQK